MDDRDDGTEQELEPPIEALRAVLEDPPEDLPARVRGSINRRLLASDAVDLSFNQVLHVVLEFVKIIFEGLRGGESRKDGQG